MAVYMVESEGSFFLIWL